MVATTAEEIVSAMVSLLRSARSTVRARRVLRELRRAAAALELALVLPVLLSLILGAVEFNRALLACQVLTSAAREGVRAGSVAQGDNVRIVTAVTNYLTTAQVPTTGLTTTVLVNGSALDAAQAQRGDTVSVRVTLPYRSVNWLPAPRFLGGKTLVGAAVMRRE